MANLRVKMMKLTLLLSIAVLSAAQAARVERGVLLVDGEPFFPLGSWNSGDTTPEDIGRLGMNTSFRGAPSDDESVERFRGFMRRCNNLGIQVIPYLSYGGAGVTPWSPEAIRRVSKLADEPNLLGWYVGDDIGIRHLEGIRQTVNTLREHTPHVPTVADYIAEETSEAKTTFTQYIDIRCQYYYPIPDQSLQYYLDFFERQRRFVGDPLWTWIQCFMWGSTGRFLNVGAEGPGPMPDPDQVRLLSLCAINRGVRGLLFFPHHELHRLPELAAEVALLCREIRLFEKHLAAGGPTYDLGTSDPDLNATAFRYNGSVVVSLGLFREGYQRWVDEAVVTDVTVEVPWSDSEQPRAFLVATPDLVECSVLAGAEDSTICVRIPILELGGFVLLSTDPEEIEHLRSGIRKIPHQLRKLVVPGLATQTRKVCAMVWQLTEDNLYAPDVVMKAMRAQEICADAIDRGDYAEAVRSWRAGLKICRGIVRRMMDFAEARREIVPPYQRRYLDFPYGLHNIRGLGAAPPADDPWVFIKNWNICGPFPLEWNGRKEVAPGFERSYGPESDLSPNARFEGTDGSTHWSTVSTDLSGLLDFLPYFETTENVVCYAACTVIAPTTMEARFSLGSNDGARVWVNGRDVFTWSSTPHGGRSASPHQDEFPVRLNQGENNLLVKVENLGGNWQLYLSVNDPNRSLCFEVP